MSKRFHLYSPRVTMERFCSRGQHQVQIHWNKGKRLHKKEFNSHRIDSKHQHGRRFIVLGHQYGCRDVTWKHHCFGASIWRTLTSLWKRSIKNSVQLLSKVFLLISTSECKHQCHPHWDPYQLKSKALTNTGRNLSEIWKGCKRVFFSVEFFNIFTS